MVANVEAMVRTGIEAYRDGKKAEARKLLEKAIELDDYNEQAWMWLSAVVETDEEKKTCLENVLVINPDNDEAKRGLKMLGVDSTSTTSSTPETSSESNPFTDTGMADFGDVDFTADTSDNDDWADPPTATSSSSSVYSGPETSASEYDSWVDNLNLGAGGEEIAEPEATPDTFENNDLTDLFGLDDSDDIFGTNDPFGSDVQFDDDDVDAASTFTSGPFGGGTDTDDFGLDDAPSSTPQSPPKAQPVTSPGAENLDDDFLNDLGSADFSGGDFIMGDEDFENTNQPDFTPDELFSFIPDEIKATRLPGTRQGVSIASVLILVVLIAMNVGAAAFIAMGLT